MKRTRPKCPQCGKKLRNAKAVMSHVRDAHSHFGVMQQMRNLPQSPSVSSVAIPAIGLSLTVAAAIYAARYWGVI